MYIYWYFMYIILFCEITLPTCSTNGILIYKLILGLLLKLKLKFAIIRKFTQFIFTL